MLLAKKSPEIFPKHKEYFFTLQSFALNWYIFVALKSKKLLFTLQSRLKQNSVFDLEKLIEYWASAVNAVSNPRVAPLPRTEIPFLLLQHAQMSSNKIQK